MTFAILFVVVVVGALGFLALLASRTKTAYDRSNEVVPGRPTTAPASWAGSHEPEALLHRRLRDAMAAMRANRDFDDNPMFIDLRVELEEQALALDERLVAAAALPVGLRDEPLAQAAEHTERIEQAVAALAGRSAADALPALQRTLDEIRERTALVGDATNALDAPSPLDDQVLQPYPVDPPTPLTAPAAATEPPTVASDPPAGTTEPPSTSTPPAPPAAPPPEADAAP